MGDFVFHSIEQNVKTYTRKGTDSKLNKSKSEKEKQFDQLLNTKCSWSYKQMNTTNNESLSSSQNNDSTPSFVPNVKKNKSNGTKTKRNTLEMDHHNEKEQNGGTKNVFGVEEEHISTSSFDGLLPKKNLSPRNKPQNKSNVTRDRKNLRSLKPINYANESSSDEELVLQSRVYNRSKFDDSDEEEMENGKKKGSVPKDVSGDIKFDDSPPSNESSPLKDTDIPNSPVNFFNQDSNKNTSRNDTLDDESVSPNILFANETKSKESFRSKKDTSKLDHSDEEMEKDMKKDIVSKTVSGDIKFDDSPPCNESPCLKDTNTPNSSDNSSNRNSYRDISRNQNMDDDSISPNMEFTTETKSKDSFRLKKDTSKYDHRNEEEMKNSLKKDTVSKNVSGGLKFDDSPSCNEETSLLKDIDTPNSLDNSSNKDSYLNISRNDNMDDESVSPNMVLTNKTKSKEDNAELEIKTLHTDEKVKRVSTNRKKTPPLKEITTPFHDSKKKTKSREDNFEEINISNTDDDSDNFNERSTPIKHIRTQKEQVPIAGDKEIEKDQDLDFNNSFFRTSFTGLSNDEAIGEEIGDDLPIFDDSDASTGEEYLIKESRVPLLNASKNTTEHLSNKNNKPQGLQEVIHKGNKVKESFTSKIPSKSKRNSNPTGDIICIQSDNEDAGKIVSTKHQKKVYKGKKLDVNGVPNEVKDIHDAISLELQSISNKADMTGSLSEDDEFTRDFMDGKLDFNKLHEYCKTFKFQSNQTDKKCSMKCNSSSKIQKEKEFDVCLNEDPSTKKQRRTQNTPFISTSTTNKSKERKTIHANNLINNDTVVDTSYFREITGKRKQKEDKCKAEKNVLRSRQKNPTSSKPSTKNHISQELDNLNHLDYNGSYGNESEDSCCIINNTSNQSNIEQKKESNSKSKNNKNSIEKSINLSTPSLSPAIHSPVVDTSYFRELTGKRNQKEEKCKAEKYVLRSRQKKPTSSKPSTKNHVSQELDNCNGSYGNELEDSCFIINNMSFQSNTEQKKESKSKSKNNKNSTEKNINLSTPSLSPAFLTKPVKRKKAAALATSKTENKSEEWILKVQKKDEAGILDSVRKKPMKSWDDLEAELLPNVNENKNRKNKNASEESLSFLNDKDTNRFSDYEKIEHPKEVERQRNVNVSKKFSVHEHNSKTFKLNEPSRKRKSPQIKYVFNKSPKKDDKEATSHGCKNKSTSLVAYASNASIIEKTIANMNRTTSPYLQQSREKYQPSKGRNSDKNYMDGIPVEFSYSIQQIKSTMYIKPSKRTQDISQNEILNTRQKTSEKQNKIKDNNTPPIFLEGKILPALTITTPYKKLDSGMMPSRQNRLATKATQKQNVVTNNKVSGKQEKFMNSKKAKENERDIQDTSNSSSEDEITYKRYLPNEEQLHAMKNYSLGKRKLHDNSEKSNPSSKNPKKEPSKEKTCRDEMKRKTGDLSEEEMTFHSRKQQKTRQEMKQDHSKETEKVIMNKEKTDKKNYDNFSSDSSEGYQTIEMIKDSKLQGNGRFSSLANGIRTKNRYPSAENPKEMPASKSTAAQKKPEERKDVDDYLKYLKNISKTEDVLSQGTFKYGDKPKTGKKQMEDSSDDVFSISSFETDDTDKEVPKGTGLLCDLFDG